MCLRVSPVVYRRTLNPKMHNIVCSLGRGINHYWTIVLQSRLTTFHFDPVINRHWQALSKAHLMRIRLSPAYDIVTIYQNSLTISSLTIWLSDYSDFRVFFRFSFDVGDVTDFSHRNSYKLRFSSSSFHFSDETLIDFLLHTRDFLGVCGWSDRCDTRRKLLTVNSCSLSPGHT